jgi:hypothetical protein
VYPHDDVKVYLHEKDCDHNDLPFEKSRGLSDQLKAIINECVERGQAKPKQIIAEMRRSGISVQMNRNICDKRLAHTSHIRKKRDMENLGLLLLIFISFARTMKKIRNWKINVMLLVMNFRRT